LGSWLSFFALLSMLASIFTGKVVHYKKYDRLVVVGGVAFLTLFGLLYFFPSLAIFILFGAVQEIAANMINIPRRVYSDNLIHHVKDYKEHRLGYIVSREFFAVGIGMFSSYVLLLFSNELSFTQLSLYSLLIATAVIIQIGLLISIKYSQTDLNG